MKAIVYDFSISNFLKTRAAVHSPIKLLETGRIPGLSEADIPAPRLRGEEWMRLKPLLSGICGSDLSMLTNSAGPALTPFFSYPLVPGHEVVAEVVETGNAVKGVAPGQRVIVNPTISCEMRGLVPCRSCASGAAGLCTNAAEGSISPGMLTGFCKDLPGGWSAGMIAHQSQVFPVPPSIPDQTAVLIEPFSVAVHAVLQNPPAPDDKVLIIGSGSIGLLTLAALRRLGHNCDITMLARHPAQVDLATRFGATRVLRGATAGEAAVQITGATRYKPIIGQPVYTGGFDCVFDCVGSASSVNDSLRVTRPRGHIAMIGCAAEIKKLDLTFVWSRELTIHGNYIYGSEPTLPGNPHTFQVAMKLLLEQPEPSLRDIVTHMFPLSAWREAVGVSLSRGKHAAIKVVFDCR